MTIFSIAIICSISARAGTGDYAVVRQYPMAGSKQVSTLTSIGITSPVDFNLQKEAWADFHVQGFSSGIHSGTLTLSDDRLTAIFKPTLPFDVHEMVQVQFTGSLIGGGVLADTFTFVTENQHLSYQAPHFDLKQTALDPLIPSSSVLIDNNPTPGRLFLNSFGTPEMGNVMVMDQDGLLLKHLSAQAMDFQIQPNGQWTYYDGNKQVFYVIDTIFNVIRTLQCVDSIQTDLHELILLPDGTYTMLGIFQTKADAQEHIVGVDSGTTILSNEIQRFDASGKCVFRWRGLDHYEVLDAIHENLTGKTIDFEHANSIDIDSNGDYLFSNRNLSEITKIDGKTGAILWRFGGAHNQFAFQNDSLGFSYQRDVRWQSHGRISMFDNGNYRPLSAHQTVADSRAAEYLLDEKTMQAWLVREYHHNPPIVAQSMGSVQRLTNDNLLIGWGTNMTGDSLGNMYSVVATEITGDDSIAFEMIFDLSGTPVFSYRVRKYPTPQQASVVEGSSSPTPYSVSDYPALSESGDGFDVAFISDGQVSVILRDILGREVEHVFGGTSSVGLQHQHIPTASLANGIYYCVLQSSRGSSVLPLPVVRR